MTPVIETRHLRAGYSGAVVVSDLDLRVDQGEVVALLGPNGAGKTTTLLTLSGVLPPISGDVRVLGRDLRAGRPHLIARRGLAFVPADRSLIGGLSVRENLRLGQRKKGVAIGDVLAYFPELAARLDMRAGLLSGGEQQMLALGRALAGAPRALLVDELTTGLAPVVVRRLLPLVREIVAATGMAVLFVDQHVERALEIADRAYVLQHGELALEGSARELAGRQELLESSYLGQASAL
jgi:branched-chain amino acid transport system ATP-binding protein